MRKHKNVVMGRKAESIYTAMKNNWVKQTKQEKVCETRQRIESFEAQMERYAASKAGYAYINGISMPILSA